MYNISSLDQQNKLVSRGPHPFSMFLCAVADLNKENGG